MCFTRLVTLVVWVDAYFSSSLDEQRNVGAYPRGSTIVKSKQRNKNFVDMVNFV